MPLAAYPMIAVSFLVFALMAFLPLFQGKIKVKPRRAAQDGRIPDLTSIARTPRLGRAIYGRLSWMVPDGARVTTGDIICVLTTDLFAMDVLAPRSGELSIVAPEGAVMRSQECVARII